MACTWGRDRLYLPLGDLFSWAARKVCSEGVETMIWGIVYQIWGLSRTQPSWGHVWEPGTLDFGVGWAPVCSPTHVSPHRSTVRSTATKTELFVNTPCLASFWDCLRPQDWAYSYLLLKMFCDVENGSFTVKTGVRVPINPQGSTKREQNQSRLGSSLPALRSSSFPSAKAQRASSVHFANSARCMGRS